MVPEAPSEAPNQLLALKKGPVNIIDAGEGPPLLSIHGVPGSVRDFRWLAGALEGPLRMIRYDLPGFAQTPLSTMPGLSFAQRADFAVEVADALGLERFALIGHSMGGGVAMHVASRHPERVAGLALVCSVALRPHRGYRRLGKNVRTVSKLLRYVPGLPWLLGPALKKSFAQNGFSPHLTTAECVHSIHCVTALDFDSIRDAVSQIQAPTLLSWSEDDPLIETAISEELGPHLPDGPRLSYPSGGHNIQKHHAVELADALIQWMNTLRF